MIVLGAVTGKDDAIYKICVILPEVFFEETKSWRCRVLFDNIEEELKTVLEIIVKK
jgi:hypothetical protein